MSAAIITHSGKSSVVLLASSETGFGNLSRLVSQGLSARATAARHGRRLDWLNRDGLDGVICLTGGPEGAIDVCLAAGQDVHAYQRLARLEELFGDRLYIELQRHGRAQEASVEPRLVDYAYRRGIPLVATNEPFFKSAKEFEAHDALLAIAGGTVLAQTERRKLNDQYYFKTRAEMVELFADLPEALDSTIEIAQRIAYRPQDARADSAQIRRRARPDRRRSRCRGSCGFAQDGGGGARHAPRHRRHLAGQDRAGIPRPAGIRAGHHRSR